MTIRHILGIAHAVPDLSGLSHSGTQFPVLLCRPLSERHVLVFLPYQTTSCISSCSVAEITMSVFPPASLVSSAYTWRCVSWASSVEHTDFVVMMDTEPLMPPQLGHGAAPLARAGRLLTDGIAALRWSAVRGCHQVTMNLVLYPRLHLLPIAQRRLPTTNSFRWQRSACLFFSLHP